ncbi:MAG: hypothetical protein M9919_05995 [Burkholderiaceae bacterium]|nr:hypothetical protein [Burkholderiaceae bacterium]
MMKPWQVTPWLAVLVLLACAWWWQIGKDAWHAPSPRLPELPALADIPTPPAFHAQQALQRPLFWTSRRPVSEGDSKGGFARDLMESRLTAVFTSGKDQIAVLKSKDGRTLKLGTDSMPWRLESFDGRRAIFVSADQQRVERLLEYAPSAESKAAQPPGQHRPPGLQ